MKTAVFTGEVTGAGVLRRATTGAATGGCKISQSDSHNFTVHRPVTEATVCNRTVEIPSGEDPKR